MSPSNDHAISTRKARRHAISEWFMEVSVLVAVFPLLDLVMKSSNDAQDWWSYWVRFRVAMFAPVVLSSCAIAGISGLVGIFLRKGE